MLLITDRRHRADTLKGPSPTIIVHLDALRDVDSTYSSVVCDLDLDNFDTVEQLKVALLKYRADISLPLIFMARDADPLTYALANALGATRIVSPAQDAISPAYIALPVANGDAEVPATQALPPLPTLVATVTSTLERMFTSAEKQEGLPLDNLSNGADALLLAIKQSCISDWISIVRGYDDATYQHCLLVAGLVAGFSQRLGLSFKAQHLLSQAALVHDIGKARVPHAILNKNGPLSLAEMEVMRKHPASGYYMIAYQKGIDGNILDIVRHHHEYLDGSGYPDRLKGDQISELCRLVTICDIFAALIEKRPYRKPMSPQEGYAILLDMGKKLDTRLVEDFRSLVDEMKATEQAAA